MPLTIDKNRIKWLQTRTPRGAPVDLSTLSGLGISSALAHYYLSSGWLERLGRGVFALPNDTLELAPSINFLAKSIPGLHVGAKTALAWRGVRQALRRCLAEVAAVVYEPVYGQLHQAKSVLSPIAARLWLGSVARNSGWPSGVGTGESFIGNAGGSGLASGSGGGPQHYGRIGILAA